jgi:hypothetical protein
LLPKGAPQPAQYGKLKGKLKGTGQQGNHVNQNAAYGGIIPEDEELSVAVRGDAIGQPGMPHYEFHRSMESFWNQFRKGGKRFGQTPTNAEYGQALEQALRAGGYTPEEAASLAARAAYRLRPSDPVPRMPGRVNQTQPLP